MSIKNAWKAIEQNDLETFKMEINHGVSINAKNVDGQSFLIHYINWDTQDWNTQYEDRLNYNFIFFLLTSGIDLNSADKYGQTALMHGIMNRMTMMVIDLLESNKFDINRQDNFGKTPLMFAAIYRLKGHEYHTKNIIKALFKHGAVNYLRDKEGKMAEDYAVSRGVKSLIKNNGSSLIGRLFS